MEVVIDTGYVRSEFQCITTAEFFHPQRPLPGKLPELAKAIHGAGNDTDIKPVILHTSGENFVPVLRSMSWRPSE
jgi:hypothetical protein